MFTKEVKMEVRIAKIRNKKKFWIDIKEGACKMTVSK